MPGRMHCFLWCRVITIKKEERERAIRGVRYVTQRWKVADNLTITGCKLIIRPKTVPALRQSRIQHQRVAAFSFLPLLSQSARPLTKGRGKPNRQSRAVFDVCVGNSITCAVKYISSFILGDWCILSALNSSITTAELHSHGSFNSQPGGWGLYTKPSSAAARDM